MAILWGFFSVFPANAGMILNVGLIAGLKNSVPRECRDDPYTQNGVKALESCSPRMRG